jgi:tRNA/tmRNA/rRNA uracil-C5-methylase (TrmA/RlmC/RlmD family)
VAAAVGSGERIVRTAAGADGRLRTLDGGALHEAAAGRHWRVSPGVFWQVHPHAADVLTDAVLDGLRPEPGERALDLYAGVGLFAGSLASAVGLAGNVIAVESSPVAATDAAHNLADLPQAQLIRADVAAALANPARFGLAGQVDIVVLDPPRSGAGAKVVRAICGRRPRAVAYVACDPAALARDLATFADEGYQLGQLRAFDLFPQTHHVECVAIVRPADTSPEATDDRAPEATDDRAPEAR